MANSQDQKPNPLIGLVVLGIIAVGVYVMFCTGSKSAPPSRPEHSKSGAWAACQMNVEPRLKSPSSAKFPFGVFPQVTEDLGGGRYRVRSYVDSQNSFGAMLRSDFDCTVKYAENKEWKLQNLDIRQD